MLDKIITLFILALAAVSELLVGVPIPLRVRVRVQVGVPLRLALGVAVRVPVAVVVAAYFLLDTFRLSFVVQKPAQLLVIPPTSCPFAPIPPP